MSKDNDEAAPAGSQPLFADVAFAIISTNQLSGQEARQLQKTLTSQGAEHIPLHPSPGKSTDVRRYTHLISPTSDFPEYQIAIDSLVPVVRPSWVEACTSRGKLANPRPYSPDPRFFFSNITISCADIPEGDKEAIIGGVQATGGQYSGPLSKAVTHLVALTLENDKCETSIKKNLKCKIVLPHWFDDCLKLGKKIDEGPYLLPDPEILSIDPGPLKLRENKDLYGASSPNAGALPTPANSFINGSSRRTLTVFKSKKVMLSSDLNVGSRLQQTIEDIITGSDGKIVTTIPEADIYVCHYREGQNYPKASQAGLVIGNLVWLYHLITHNTWTSPVRRLLHYPVPRRGVPGFSDLRISLSNYTGEARVYLENLVKSTGAEYTKTMRQDNTHLITAHMMSEKCAAAKEWNINIVNHLWLEESYARCQIQTLTDPRYTHFPRRTNLGEVVGQTQLDVEAVKRAHGNVNHSAAIFHTNGINANGGLAPSSDTSRAQRPNHAHPQHVTSPSGLASARHKSGHGHELNSKPAAAARLQSADHDPQNIDRNNKILQTPIPQRFRDSNNGSGKEDETPSTTGSRGAKARALSKLHDLAPDMALYEKEAKRVGGVVYGGRKVSDPDRVGSGERKVSGRSSRKRSFEERRDEDSSGNDDNERYESRDESAMVTDEDENHRKAKKPKAGGKQQIVQRIMLSGDQRWVDKQRKEADEKAKLREIGIHITQNPNDATILCAPKIVRTKKFVCAIASAPTIVSTSYLDYCLKHNAIPHAKDHLLVDRTNENLYGFRLAEALERAKQNNQQLLKGWQIFCTEDVHGGFDTFREVVATNGGICSLYKGRTGVVISKRGNAKIADNDDNLDVDDLDDSESNTAVNRNRVKGEGDTVYLISDPKTGDESTLWNKFRQMARKHNMKPRIVKPDWLLFVAMAQYIEWDEKWALTEDGC